MNLSYTICSSHLTFQLISARHLYVYKLYHLKKNQRFTCDCLNHWFPLTKWLLIPVVNCDPTRHDCLNHWFPQGFPWSPHEISCFFVCDPTRHCLNGANESEQKADTASTSQRPVPALRRWLRGNQTWGAVRCCPHVAAKELAIEAG